MTSSFRYKALFFTKIGNFLLAVAVAGITTTKVWASPVNHRDAVVEHLEGTMTASVQPQDNAPTIQVQMTTCQVDVPQKTDSVILYQEQGIVGKLDRPYRQRFLEIKSDRTNNLVYSYSYKPSNLENWSNFCNRFPEPRTVSKENLGELVCTVTLKPFLNVYLGTTPPEGCQAEVRGAVRITNRIILHQEGMDTWDRGFDESGEQVWGAENEAYQFRR